MSETKDLGDSQDDLFDGCPMIPQGLIEYLRSKEPLQIPNIGWTDRQLGVYIGIQEMIQRLEFIHSNQLQKAAKENVTYVHGQQQAPDH